MIRRTAAATLVAAFLVALGAVPALGGGGGHGCASGAEIIDEASTEVDMLDSCFTPTVTRVARGAKVTWVNRDPYLHTVTAPGGWGAGFKEFTQGDRIAFRFAEEGVFPYSCLLHPGMTGVVVVGDGVPSGSAAASIEAADPGQPPRGSAAAESAQALDSSSLPLMALLLGAALLASGAGVVLALRRKTRAATASLRADF